MKKVCFYLLGMALVGLSACNPTPKKEAVPKQLNEAAEMEDTVKPPAGIISLDEAKELCDNYETRRIPNIIEFEMAEGNSEEKFVPTQFVAFDFKTIKRYIRFVEQESQKAKVTPDSLRIYLGNYGKEGRDPNRNTVFILPTAEIGNAYGGFYIGDKGRAELIRNYWPNGGQEGEPRGKASFMPTFNTTLLQGGGSLILNYGQGGPPPINDFN